MNISNNKTIDNLKERDLFCSKDNLMKVNNRMTTKEKLQNEINKFNSKNFKSLN